MEEDWGKREHPVKGTNPHTHNILTFIARKRRQLEKECHQHILPETPHRMHLSYLSHSDNDSLAELTPQAKRAVREEQIARGGSVREFEQQQQRRHRPELSLNFLSAKKEEPKYLRRIEHSSAPRPIKEDLDREETLFELKTKEKPRRIKTQSSGSDYPTFSLIQHPKISPVVKTPVPPVTKKRKESNFSSIINEIRYMGKTSEGLEKLFSSLRGFNPFFSHLQRVIGVCLLRVGQPVLKKQESTIYRLNAHSNCFHVIMQGSVALEGNEFMNKVSEAGETLLEEVLEGQWSLERAWALTDCWLLTVGHDDYLRMQGELMRFGFKQGVNEMGSMIRRNYITKKWLRRKYKMEYNRLPRDA